MESWQSNRAVRKDLGRLNFLDGLPPAKLSDVALQLLVELGITIDGLSFNGLLEDLSKQTIERFLEVVGRLLFACSRLESMQKSLRMGL